MAEPAPDEALPRVSVVVPTYNRPDGLRACLESLARLDYPRSKLEVIVVDDGSPAPAVVSSSAEVGLAVSLIRQENRGPAAARNRGAASASGEVIAFTDDDCRPRPAWIRQLVAALAAEPSALVGGRTVNAIEGNVFAQTSQDLVSFLYEAFFSNGVPTKAAMPPFLTANNMAARRELFLALGGFEESFRFSAAEDRELSERWAAHTGPLRLRDDAVVDHYHHLGPRRFLRQHFLYGRGAMHLFRQRRVRGRSFTGLEPAGFYSAMLRYPMRQHEWARGLVGSALVVVAQGASLVGIAAEAIVPSDGGASRREAAPLERARATRDR